MSSILGETIFNKEGRVRLSELDSLEFVLLFYFDPNSLTSAILTPLMQNFYAKINYMRKKLEVVQLFKDVSPRQWLAFQSQIPWCSLPPQSSRVEHLQRIRERSPGKPVMILLTTNGSIVSTNPGQDLLRMGVECYESWRSINV
jgi:hypothetical protein